MSKEITVSYILQKAKDSIEFDQHQLLIDLVSAIERKHKCSLKEMDILYNDISISSQEFRAIEEIVGEDATPLFKFGKKKKFTGIQNSEKLAETSVLVRNCHVKVEALTLVKTFLLESGTKHEFDIRAKNSKVEVCFKNEVNV